MKKFSKRLLSWLLAAAMVFGLSGMTAFAAEADKDSAEPEVTSETETAEAPEEAASADEVEAEEPETAAPSDSEEIATLSNEDEIATIDDDDADATVKYVVRIWGIQADTYSEDGGATTQTAGLTFGPATGADYTDSYVSCGATYCIHDMSWDEIIAQSAEDPTVFESCLENGCTKAVELTPNETLFNMETVANAAAQDYSGDGVSTLYYLLNGVGSDEEHGADYGASWNYTYGSQSYDDPANVYSRSRIRTTLTGDKSNIETWMAENPGSSDFYGIDTLCDESNCLLSCFPEELQGAVVPRTTVNTGNATSGVSRGYDTTTTYDKLFLFSPTETGLAGEYAWEDSGGTDYGIFTANTERRAYEYSDATAASTNRLAWWSRARNSQNNASALAIGNGGGVNSTTSMAACCGISPGFALAGPETEEEPPEEQPDYPQSDHNYANNADEWWTYTLEGAEKGVYVTFDEQTRVETNWDYIYVYDGNDNLIGQYTGTTLAGATLYIPTETFKINLTSDSSTTYWGFAVTNVEAVEGPVDLSEYATVSDPLAPVYVNDTPSADVMINGTIALEQGTDFTVAADTGTAGETVEVTINGIGDYTGTLTTHVFVYDENNLAEGAEISPDEYIELRQKADSSMGEVFGVSYIPFTDLTDAYVSAITSITMTPVETSAPLDEGGEITGETNPDGVGYPYAAATVTITPDSDRYGYVSGNSLYFNRSESDPVVYVAAGHGFPHYYTKYGTEREYPQTQVYEIKVEATGYADTVGTVTYCTGTCSTFSIIVVDEDGNEEVAGEWDSDELAERATFANGSSQCGMTGFRTFTSKGISLSELLEECDVEVSADDYFLLDTTDHYGNYFTYKELFGTPRYFMEGIYTDEFADLYHSLGIDDADAGYDHDIRLYLGKYAWEHRDTTLVEPRIASEYNETMIYGTDLGNIEVPTEANTEFDSLVSLENRFRFIYGVALVQEDCNVTFDTQGGSEVESQTVLSHHMSSTELTTMWTSYWATSLVIYRGQGKDHPDTDQPLTGADTITVPDDPTKAGYEFAGWYTDPECTDGNEFDFTANDGTVDEDTTLYAKWDAALESDHPYGNGIDETWDYTLEGADEGVYITFDERTATESGYDYIYIYDGDGNLIGQYTGTSLAGATVYIPTASFSIRLTSDSSYDDWGFAVTNVEAAEYPIDLEVYGYVADPSTSVYVGDVPTPKVLLDGSGSSLALVQDEDFIVSADTSVAGTTVEVTITGTGKYTGTLTTHVYVYDESTLLEPAAVKTEMRQLRQSSDTGTSRVTLDGADDSYRANITEVTLTPVETDALLDDGGTVTGPTTSADTGGLEYPEAPKEITLTADELTISGNNLTFNRTEEEPIVYVTEGHGYPYISETYRNDELYRRQVYPQTQVYEVTVKAAGYEDAVGLTTYYTGTSAGFSIIEDLDGNRFTTDDQTVLKTWTSDEIREMASFANGSSQCGMTGFRTFTTNGVSLVDLLEDAGTTVSADDSFLLQTSDDYGNTFSYSQLFGATRYFMSGIYDPEFVDIYNQAENDADSGGNDLIRRWLAAYALEHGTTIDPRICVDYREDLIYGSDIRAGVELPTAENTTFNSLVSFENQYRFVYGIEIVQDAVNVNFDTQGGSEVETQTVLTHPMTSTSNTTMSSSYWGTALYIYRGQGDGVEHPSQPEGADTITVPEDPTRDGYVFAGWYTDPECTDGNEFDFTANDGTVDENTTIYAKWVTDKEALEDEITVADELIESDYTPESWAALQAVLDEAKAVAADESASPEEVNEALEALEAAIDALEAIPADKDALEATIAEAGELNEDDYTPASWEALEEALAAAEAVNDDPDALQSAVDAAQKALQDAMDALTEKADKEILEAAIGDADALNESDYTKDSWEALQTALTAAKDVDADENASQADVNSAAIDLIAAIANLEFNEPQPDEPDKTELLNEFVEAMGLSENDYTPESWAPLADALANAQSVLTNPDATQDDVEAAEEALKAALDNLEPVAPSEIKDGLIKDSDGVWRLYKDNVFQGDYTGFAENEYGKWYVERGVVTFTVTNILKDKTGAIGTAGDWYYVIDSKVQESFTGLSNFSNQYGWWYIVNGKVDFTRNSVDKNVNGWWYVVGGKVQLSFTGLANYKNQYGWWYIEGGRVNFNHNGVEKNKNGWWYVTGSKVQFDFTGLANHRNDHGWWYIESGKVNFNHTGVEKNVNGWWYVKDSKVDFSYNGKASNVYGTWNIVNGKVVF